MGVHQRLRELSMGKWLQLGVDGSDQELSQPLRTESPTTKTRIALYRPPASAALIRRFSD
jgi:hypothetical protein